MARLKDRIEAIERARGVGQDRIKCIVLPLLFPPPGAQQPDVVGARSAGIGRSLHSSEEWYLPRDPGENEEAFVERAEQYAIAQNADPNVLPSLVLEYDAEQVAALEAANKFRV